MVLASGVQHHDELFMHLGKRSTQEAWRPPDTGPAAVTRHERLCPQPRDGLCNGPLLRLNPPRLPPTAARPAHLEAIQAPPYPGARFCFVCTFFLFVRLHRPVRSCGSLLCLTYFTEDNALQVLRVVTKGKGSRLSHFAVCAHRLLVLPQPFIHRWTLGWRPLLGHGKHRCDEHWGALEVGHLIS